MKIIFIAFEIFITKKGVNVLNDVFSDIKNNLAKEDKNEGDNTDKVRKQRNRKQT